MISKFIVVATLLMTSHPSGAADNSDAIRGDLTVAAEWARAVYEGNDTTAIEQKLSAPKRLIPFGKTIISNGTSSRVTTKIFQIVRNGNQMIFLSPSKGAVRLLVGAPVSDETMKQARINSFNLIMEPPVRELKFESVLSRLIHASDHLKYTDGVEAVAKQDPFNKAVMEVGKFALVEIDLDNKLTSQQLTEYLFDIEVRPFLALDEARKEELVVREKMEKTIIDLGYSAEEAKIIADELLDSKNVSKSSAEVIAAFDQKQTGNR